MRPRAPRVVTSYISKEDKLRFDECDFRGFYAVYRTVRRYPRKVGGNLLGFVGEVNARQFTMKRHPDYQVRAITSGMSGVESAYEPLLKGKKGVKIQEIDTHGAIKGSYMNGVYDSLPEPGRYLVSTIDARLQPAGRGADARQGRGGRGDRTLDGRDPDDGLLADVRSRRTGRPGARQQLHEDDLQQAASAFQPCREGEIPAGIDLQARAGPDRAAGGRAQALGPATSCHEGYQVRPPAR